MTESIPPVRNAPPGALFHWTLFGTAAAVVALSLVLRVEGQEKVVVPVVNKALPGVCTYKRWLGISCPGCGLTRSFISIAHGDMIRAWHFNPAGMLLFGVVVGQIPYRSWQLWRLRHGRSEYRLGKFSNVLFFSVGIALFAQWIIRIGLGSI